MSTNISALDFRETGNSIIVRMYTTLGGSSTWDFTGITDIDFSHPAGVTVIYPNEPGQTAKVFIPYSTIQQIIQVQ